MSFLVKVGDARPANGDVLSASPVYRLKGYADGFPTIEPRTLFEVFERSCEKYADKECLGRRPADGKPFEFDTYKQVQKKVANIASGLRHLGVAPKQRVGILGMNCPEWMIAMQSCNRMSFECVPLYDTLGENAIEYIINHSEAVVAFTSSAKFPQLAKALDKVKEVLKIVIYWGDGNKEAAQAAKNNGLIVHSFDELMKLGEQHPADPVAPSPDDLCTIMYTSGTTGDPKGVMLKHSAVIGGIVNTYSTLKMYNITISPGEKMLSYLPLAHIFDRVLEETWLFLGGAIGYYQGDPLKLLDDIYVLKPSIMIGVPRVYDRIHSKITSGLASAGFLKRLLFNWGFNRKLHNMKEGEKQKEASPFFDRLVFSKVAERFGGKIKIVVSGGAPLAQHVEEFLRVIMCCPVVQGYGLTETCAASFISAADVWAQVGTVGPPFPATEFRLESVPEMNYDALAPEPKGEVLIRGPLLFSGYYKQPDKTAEVMDADGWFHSGDIGMLMPDGSLKIIDRKKNIFKLSQGEYVAVEKLENTYKKAPIVEQVWVYGNSFKNSLVSVVVPQQEAITKWASANGISGTFEELCKNEKVKAYVLQELQAVGKADKLKGFEIVKAVHLDPKMFTVEEDLLTPTFKLKRPQLQQKYHTAIEKMYLESKEAGSTL